jgi:hypothetical protein
MWWRATLSTCQSPGAVSTQGRVATVLHRTPLFKLFAQRKSLAAVNMFSFYDFFLLETKNSN